MQITMSKHQGLGNDFFVYDIRQGLPFTSGDPDAQWATFARNWCDRRFGIGADGVLLLGREGTNQLTMVLYNADGSRAEISGNGIRCLVQAAYWQDQHNGAVTYVVNTDAGVRTVDVLEGSPTSNVAHISVGMGVVSDIAEPANWAALQCNPDRPVRHLSLGNPHSVVSVEDVADVNLQTLGELVPHVNLEIVAPGPEAHAITMRVHERGSGITLACGSGACASAVAAKAWGFVPASAPEVLVHMDGGDARVRIDAATSEATLIGPSVFIANVVFDV
ncbi:MAG: diaminopimelate epimerase [Ilumatobacteraceae bacterium]|nr:diaminopimelate epimerase [Ilumatobacteraceae bacterium]